MSKLGTSGGGPCPRSLQLPLPKSFSSIPVEAEDIEPEQTIFKASVVEAAAVSCGHRVLGASRGGNPQTPWWTLVVREAVQLKESFRDMLSRRTTEAVLVWRGHGEGLSGGSKALLDNRTPPQEGETGNHPSCVQQGWDFELRS